MKTIYSPIAEPMNSYSFLQPITKIAFFDIETTGLSPNASSLYLIGLMRFDADKNQWMLCQWFADNYQSEKQLIISFLEALSDVEYLYHFNGKTFDIPYLLKKCARHAITLPQHCSELLNDSTNTHSIDLLGKIRPLRHALLLEKCNQTALECWLGVNRTDTFSGAELISVYSEYMQQKILNPDNAWKLEQVLLLHNHDDVEMMLTLCSLLTYEEYLSDAEGNRLFCQEALNSLTVTSHEAETLTLSLTLPVPVPKKVTLSAYYPALSTDKENEGKNLSPKETPSSFWSKVPEASLTLDKNTAVLTLPLYHGTLKYFFPNYKDYYYLPKEDTAMHKSVAEFVDSAYRKKATAATCYTKKEGTFLPNLFPAKKTKQTDTDSDSALFFLQYKDKLSFFELPEDFTANTVFWKNYLPKQLPYFR